MNKKRPDNMKFAYYAANIFGTWLTNILLGTRLTDSMTCFKVFRKNTLNNIKLTAGGFGADAELTAKVAKRGFKIKEIGIPYKARTFKEGKKFHPLCSLGVLWAIIRYSSGK